MVSLSNDSLTKVISLNIMPLGLFKNSGIVTLYLDLLEFVRTCLSQILQNLSQSSSLSKANLFQEKRRHICEVIPQNSNFLSPNSFLWLFFRPSILPMSF